MKCHQEQHLATLEAQMKAINDPEADICPIDGEECDVADPLSTMWKRSVHVNTHNKKGAQLASWMSSCRFSDCRAFKTS